MQLVSVCWHMCVVQGSIISVYAGAHSHILSSHEHVELAPALATGWHDEDAETTICGRVSWYVPPGGLQQG